MKNRLYLAVFFLLSGCTGSFQDTMLEKDIQGRELSVMIDYPVEQLITYQDKITLSGRAYDKKNAMRAVEVKTGGADYVSAELTGNYWEKEVLLSNGKNTLCARVTTDLEGTRSSCVDVYRILNHLPSVPEKSDLTYSSVFHFKSAGCAAHAGKIYCVGGEWNEDNLSIYDISAQEWVSVAKIMIGGTKYSRKFAGVTLGEISGKMKLFVLGGLDTLENPVLQDLVYDVESASWQIFSPPRLTLMRVSPRAVTVGNKIYLMGGGTALPGVPPVFLATTEVLDLADPGSGWQSLGKSMHQARVGFVEALWGQKIIVAGGYNQEGKMLSGAEVLDTEHLDAGWQKMPEMNYARFLAAGAILDNYLYIFGGMDNRHKIPELERFNLGTWVWEKAGHTDYLLTEAGYAAWNNRLYLVGGEGDHGIMNNYSYEYCPYEN